MAIVKMDKFNLYTFDSDRTHLLNALQNFKQVHFNDLKSSEEEYPKELEVPEEVEILDKEIADANWIIELISKYEPKAGTIQGLVEGNKNLSLKDLEIRAKSFDFKSKHLKLSNLVKEQTKLIQDNLSLEQKIEELNPWKKLSISNSEVDSFKNVIVQTATVSTKYYLDFKKYINTLEFTDIDVLYQDKNFVYLVIFSDKDEFKKIEEDLKSYTFTEARIKTDKVVAEEINGLKESIKGNKDRIKVLQKEIESYVEYLEDFEVYYEYLRNRRLKLQSSKNFLRTQSINIIEGYLPSSLKESFLSMLDKEFSNNYYIEIDKADKEDVNVPIILDNNSFVSPFESLTEMYSMPKYNEIDPTPLFAPFYFIFAGIMVGDVGYGLIILLGCLFALKAFHLSNSKKRFVKFIMYLGISAIMWGFVFGSFLGDFGSAVGLKTYLDPAKDYMEMIAMSILLGMIHIFFALAIKAYMNFRDHKPLDALFDVGFWYMALIGLIVFGISKYVLHLDSIIPSVAIKVAIVGMVGIVLTGGRDQSSIGGKIGWGVYSLYGITSYLGDFVSYLRLMALVLSGSFIAVAVNTIVRMLFDAGIVGMVAGAIIFLVFQLFNVFLSYLSAYVHTARLTYVEMFNKFYEGGGIPFKRMVEDSKYFNIEEE